ncbi:MAG: hypothetical protein JNM93_12260 [Bacteriovoracaceae bacterium]|nr:hypothetical protein [Bacteriovoracaceae bacterium]
MEHYLAIFYKALFNQNVIVALGLGLYSVFKFSERIRMAFWFGLVIFLSVTLSTIINSVLYHYVIKPDALAWVGYHGLDLSILKYFLYFGTIAAVMKLIELVLTKLDFMDLSTVENFYPLAILNSAILCAALLAEQNNYLVLESTIFGVGSGLGFLFMIMVIAGLRNRMEYSDIPESLNGLGIFFMTIGILAMVFLSFSSLKI